MASRKSFVVAGISGAVAGLSLAFLGLLGYWLASPYLASHELKSGAQEGDPDKIIKHVDIKLIFNRRGFADWKLISIALPPP